MPFEITATVVLPDHLHFLWTLPPNDWDYSRRVGRLKVLFTQALRGTEALPQDVSVSRQKHRESDVWQRRFWEHTITNESDLARHFDYLHYNPVNLALFIPQLLQVISLEPLQAILQSQIDPVDKDNPHQTHQ
jgi:putative transposase